MVSNYLQPVFGVLSAAVLLREKITWNMISGGLLVLAGTALATFEDAWRSKRSTREPEIATHRPARLSE
jgi:drug/metabolite transporter (DMT)-like permease